MNSLKIGIFTYGTRGDVQPYLALALGLMAKGHQVSLSAPSDFKDFVESYGIPFEGLYGQAKQMMNSAEGRQVLKSENTIKLMKHFFGVLDQIKVPLRKSYYEAISKVDFIIANAATLPIVGAIAEKQNKKMALTYFMPPIVPTSAFPLADFDFLNFPLYNRFTYALAHWFYWKFVKTETNAYREELGLQPLKQNLVAYIDQQKPLDLYCLSSHLISPPPDWEPHHKITGFLTMPDEPRAGTVELNPSLNNWLENGPKPIYIGFGSNGIGMPQKFITVIESLLENHRVLFCSGWSQLVGLPSHPNLFIAEYVHHPSVLTKCKLGIFHGGAGTLAAMLRHSLPVIIISFYTDQPTWGKIVEQKKLGAHIPLKKLTARRVHAAIATATKEEIKENVEKMAELLKNENGLAQAIAEIETYFGYNVDLH